jgi:hypothetical protein
MIRAITLRLATAALAAVLAAALASPYPAFAQRAPAAKGGQAAPPQQRQTNTTPLGKMFDFDLAELLPGAADKLQTITRGFPMPLPECPQGPTLKAIVARGGDPIFNETLGAARTEALDEVMRKIGGYYSVEWGYGPVRNDGEVEVNYGALPDKEKPTLRVTSQPKKGTKVKAGDKIRIDIAARDDANAWQTGIKLIQVLDNEHKFDEQDYSHEAFGGAKSKCEPERRTRDWWTTYTVPHNLPPVVRLTVIAEDFAGNSASESAEFPTGDWYGRIVVQHKRVSPPPHIGESLSRFSVDLALHYDDKGNLAGQALGSGTLKSRVVKPLNAWGAGCTKTESEETEETVKPAKIQGTLVGSYTPGRALSINVAREQSTAMTNRHRHRLLKDLSGSRCGGEWDKEEKSAGENFLESLAGILGTQLKLTPDGRFEYELNQPEPPGGHFRIHVWLRQAEQ